MNKPTTHEHSEEPSIRPALVVVWDPELITAREYADLIDALADLARSHNAVGLVRLRSPGSQVPLQAGVPK